MFDNLYVIGLTGGIASGKILLVTILIINIKK